MNKYKIIKKLGEGAYGIVYQVNYNDIIYALKIQKIKETDLKENYRSHIWREIEFSNFTKRYDNHFMKLIEYKFIKSKKELPNYKKINDKEKSELKKFIKESNCIIFIYELKDGDLKFLLPKLSSKQIFSLFIQFSYISYLLSQEGYRHGDIHYQNIMYIKVDENKMIKIFDKDIPTFGYIFSLIDYGLIINKKYDLNKYEKTKFKYNINDLDIFMNGLKHKPITKYIIKNNINTNIDDVISNIEQTSEYNYVVKYLFNNYSITNENIIINMMLALNEKKTLKLLNVNKQYHKIDKYNIFNKIEKNDFLFIWKNIGNPRNIIDYFSNKI